MTRHITMAMILLTVVVVWGGPGALAQVRKTAALQVLPAVEPDTEVAVQVRKIAVDTLENYRNLATKRYLADKDEKALGELDELITAGQKKVSTGLRSTVFDEGVDELNRAYLKAKGLLGEMEPAGVANLYLGLAMGKAVLSDLDLATEYMMLFRNLLPDRKRSSVGYAKLFLEVFDRTQKELDKTRSFKVKIHTDPPGALVGVDGREWGRSPLEVSVTPGGHLVQVEQEGFYRGGWLKDPALHGKKWEVSLTPIESRSRFLEKQKRLLHHFAPDAFKAEEPPAGKKRRKKKKDKAVAAPRPIEDVEAELDSLRVLLKSDYLLFLAVTSSGASIRLRGAFLSRFGMFEIDQTTQRNSRIIESVRKIVLAATDLDKQKDTLVQLNKERQAAKLAAWANDLVGQMEDDRQELIRRSGMWKIVGQAKKAELFATTSADVLVLLEQTRQARADAVANPEEALARLDKHSEAWKQLGSKVRSLLAWDLEAAIRGRRVKRMKDLLESAGQKHLEVGELWDKKRELFDPKQAKDLDNELKQMGLTLAKLESGFRKAPLSVETKTSIYAMLLRQAELSRRLALKR